MRIAWKIAAQIFSFVATILTLATILLSPPSGDPAQQDKNKGSMTGRDMSGEDMSNAGPGMSAVDGAHANHAGTTEAAEARRRPK